jgi:hypothetical protein
MLETPVQQRIRLLMPSLETMLWRNNSGAFYDGVRMVRYGLANDSAKLNEKIKSSDLIGIRRVTITPDMIGKTVGIFVAIETKASDWHMTPGDKRAAAQGEFHRVVREYGGLAGFATSELDASLLVQPGLLK